MALTPLASPLADPRAVAADSKGNVYVLERGGNALRVVDRKGKIRTLIAPARRRFRYQAKVEPDLNGPKHLCVDRNDKVIIADAENNLDSEVRPKSGEDRRHCGNRKAREGNRRR